MAMLPHLSTGALWVPDARGEGRGVLVSSKPEAGVVMISVWRDNVCVATVRLAPDDAASAVAALADGLAHLDAAPAEHARPSGHARPSA